MGPAAPPPALLEAGGAVRGPEVQVWPPPLDCDGLCAVLWV
jgi:hypothetical protein